MLRFSRALLVFLLAGPVSGCYSLSGPPQIINASGIVNHPATAPNARTANLKSNFAYAANKAANSSTTSKLAVDEMVDTGVLLVRSNCADFFRRMSIIQRESRISRDMIAPIVSVLSGMVTLRNFNNDKNGDYLQAFGLGSSVAIAGLDIADKHFLFGADNIHEVQELTFKALVAHQTALLRKDDLNFERAVEHLIDHQIICTPASILNLTKKAIAAGTVTANASPSTVSANGDHLVLVALGTELGLPGAVTPQQAGALWWLLWGGGSLSDVNPKLSSLGGANPVQTDGAGTLTLNGNFAVKRSKLATLLDQFSPETKASFAATVQNLAVDPKAEFSLARTSSAADKIVLDVQ